MSIQVIGGIVGVAAAFALAVWLALCMRRAPTPFMVIYLTIAALIAGGVIVSIQSGGFAAVMAGRP